VIKLLKGKIISNIFSFQGHRTLKPIDQNLFKKNYFLFNLKLNGRKLGFNTPLSFKQFWRQRIQAKGGGKLLILGLNMQNELGALQKFMWLLYNNNKY